jgi:hypothetical protein
METHKLNILLYLIKILLWIRGIIEISIKSFQKVYLVFYASQLMHQSRSIFLIKL